MATLEKTRQTPQWCTLPFDQNRNLLTPPQPQRNMWVELLDKPNPLSHNEALLLCEKSETEWVAWVPDHGEAILGIHQFCCPVN